MSTYELLSLIVNFFIAVGTLGAIASALYLANKNSKFSTTENCSVEAEFVAFVVGYGYTPNYEAACPQTSALQICIYNHGIRDFYIQSISLLCDDVPFVFSRDLCSEQDAKVQSGYRKVVHIKICGLMDNIKFIEFYEKYGAGRCHKICVETVFKSHFYAILSEDTFRMVDGYIKLQNLSNTNL